MNPMEGKRFRLDGQSPARVSVAARTAQGRMQRRTPTLYLPPCTLRSKNGAPVASQHTLQNQQVRGSVSRRSKNVRFSNEFLRALSILEYGVFTSRHQAQQVVVWAYWLCQV
jgi:hypothetical protein